jgi:acyl-CoA synthetase (AMP-forming)/AMP-acid ligase II
MPAKEMAWPIQQSDRQWVEPEGDDPRTLYQMLMVSQKLFGDEPCFGFIPSPGMARIHLTYNEFGDLSTAMAKGLREIGVEKGDRVAIILDNSVEWAALSYGANALGAAYTAMYTHQHGKDWAYILEDATPKVVAVQSTEVLDKLCGALADDAWPASGVILLGDEPANQLPPKGVEVRSWTEMVQAGRAAEDLAEIADDPSALSTLIYTSGTTGNPKGVMLSNWNTLSNVLCVQGVFELYPGDKNAAFLPWAHSFGSTFDLHWMIRMGVHINLISDLPRSQTNVSKSSRLHYWQFLVFGTSSTTVLTLNSKAQLESRNCLLERHRKPLQRESQRLMFSVMLSHQVDSLTSYGTNWFGLRYVHDSVETFDSVCLVLLHYLLTLLNSFRKLDSTATKDMVLQKPAHLYLQTDGWAKESLA